MQNFDPKSDKCTFIRKNYFGKSENLPFRFSQIYTGQKKNCSYAKSNFDASFPYLKCKIQKKKIIFIAPTDFNHNFRFSRMSNFFFSACKRGRAVSRFIYFLNLDMKRFNALSFGKRFETLETTIFH